MAKGLTKEGGLLQVWFPLAAYMGLIFFMSSRHDVPTLPLFTAGDKAAHLVEYAILALLWVRALKHRWPDIDEKRLFAAAVLCTGLYGISDEVHQYFVPGRNADPYDVVMDIIGAVAGSRLALWFMGVGWGGARREVTVEERKEGERKL